MAKCKNCKNLDHILNRGVSVGRWCVEKSDSPDIERERNCDKYVPMTQGDKIRSMSDEELAEFFLKVNIAYAEPCMTGESDCVWEDYPTHDKGCKDCFLEWLKSEVGCE